MIALMGESNYFDSEKHQYWSSGILYPSITQLIKEANAIDTQYFNTRHALRGRAVHLATQLLDEQDLDEESINDTIRPFFEAYEKFKFQSKCTPLYIELPLINKKHRFGGTLDRIIEINGERAILEIKSGQIDYNAVKLQTAGQYLLIAENLKINILKRLAIQLKDNGNYSLWPIPSETLDQDINYFSKIAKEHWEKIEVTENE